VSDSSASRAGAGVARAHGVGALERWAFAGAAVILLVVTYAGGVFASITADLGDERAYIRYAHNIIHGHYAIASQASHGLYLWHGPGLPLVLAPLVALHAGVHVLRLLGPVSLLLAGVFFWLFLRPRVSRWLALAGGLVLALFPPLLVLLPHMRSEPLALMFLMASLWALGKAHGSGSSRWAVLGGVLAGCMVLTRVEDGYILLVGLLACAVAFALRRERRHLLNLICVGSAVVVCLPWLGYTASLTHKFPYWASSGGLSLYLMASPTPGNTGSWVSVETIATDPHWHADRAVIRSLSGLSQVQQDAKLQSIAFRLIRKHPGAYLEHVADNLSRTVLGGPYSFEATGRGYLFYGVPDVIVLVAVLLVVVMLRRRGAPGLPDAVRVLAIFGGLNLLLHLAVASYPRMTTLSVPAVLAVLVLGFDQLLRARERPLSPARAVPVSA